MKKVLTIALAFSLLIGSTSTAFAQSIPSGLSGGGDARLGETTSSGPSIPAGMSGGGDARLGETPRTGGAGTVIVSTPITYTFTVPTPGTPASGIVFGPTSGTPAAATYNDSTSTAVTAEPVLPASCGIYLNDYLKMGRKNNPTEVMKLQKFLNEFNQAGITENGVFNKATDKAVRNLQAKYRAEILAPWTAKKGRNVDPTGHVFKTTKYFINITKCESLKKTLEYPVI